MSGLVMSTTTKTRISSRSIRSIGIATGPLPCHLCQRGATPPHLILPPYLHVHFEHEQQHDDE